MSKTGRKDVIAEISEIRKNIEAYLYRSHNLPEGFSYPEALQRLQFLRNSLSRRGKKTKGDEGH